MRRARTTSRGFTLVELVVYVGLVSAGVLLIGGVELFAQRSLHLQQALIEVELQTAKYGGLLRLDVEQARSISVEGDVLTIVTLAGETVRYSPGERALLDAEGAVANVEDAPEIKGCAFTLERLASGRIRVSAELQFEVRVNNELRTKTRRRSAMTRMAVAQ